LHGVTLEDSHFALNRVEPTYLRVGADQATYDIHILIRFELERALIALDLAVRDVPCAWNDGYRRYLALTPPDDRLGCLQDGHWASGLIGYFPTYTLGNIIAAQLFTTARKELADIDTAFARGDFTSLLGWLRQNIHCQGQRYYSNALVERATGTTPHHRPLVAGLKEKYGKLYGVGQV
jgi:carboxypeptidase Taq